MIAEEHLSTVHTEEATPRSFDFSCPSDLSCEPGPTVSIDAPEGLRRSHRIRGGSFKQLWYHYFENSDSEVGEIAESSDEDD